MYPYLLKAGAIMFDCRYKMLEKVLENTKKEQSKTLQFGSVIAAGTIL